MAKIIAKIFLDRQEAGICSGSPCTDHINTLQITLKQDIELRCLLYLFFIDLEKASDSLNSEWREMMAIKRETYDGVKDYMLLRGRILEEIEVQSEVSLLPILFVLVSDTALSEGCHLHLQ